VKFNVGNRVAVAFVLGILILSSLAVVFAFVPAATHSPAAGTSSGGLRSDSAYGHGDLIVLAGQTVVLSPGTTGSTTYYEAGNISVHAGGTLIIQSLTIDWVQFIGISGNVEQRLSNVFWFSDAGRVTMSQSTITTDPFVLNAFVKLNVSVTGTMAVGDSSFEFPGWVTVSAGGSLFFNDSTSTSNSAVGVQSVSPTVLSDEEGSPALQAITGGQIFIGHSTIENYYADDFASNGIPGPDLVADNETSTAPYAWAGFDLAPPVAEGIAQAYAWEGTPLLNGYLQVGYITSTAYSTGSAGTFTYDGTGYALGPADFGLAPAGNVIDVALSSSLITYLNGNGGAPAFLQNCGQFGTGSEESVTFSFGLSSVNVTSLQILLAPDFQFNVSASGAGSTITAADSTIGVNFNPAPGTPVTLGTPPPVPWGSNKIALSGGANAYLGNITVIGAPFAPFNDSSAVLPTGTSEAYFYQWLEVPITGGLNAIPVANGTTSAAYAGSIASLGTTVAALNDLGTTDPYLATYVSAALAARGLMPSVSGGAGISWSMLVSTILDSTLLPTGQYVGAYNVTVTVPPGAPGEITHVAASLTPYPTLVSPGMPFPSPAAAFPNYQATLAVTGTTSVVPVEGNHQNTTVAIGQTITVNVTVKNSGTAPTNNYTVELVYPAAPNNIVVATTGVIKTPVSAGNSATASVSWLVNESVTGVQNKKSFVVDFVVTVIWNGGLPDGGVATSSYPITITPAFITIAYTLPTGQKLPTNGTTIDSSGTATYAGKGTGTLTVLAVGKGGQFVLLSEAMTSGVPFEVDINAVTGMQAGAAYSIQLQAAYNGRTTTDTVGTLTVAGSAPAPNYFAFLTMKFFGLPLWIWLAIAAAIVAAAVGVMLGLGRFARGRLVECGECGNLIPEDATVCPKCGAEFESDLVRCSRCGSTIPASSAVCPECAATLLARAGPENADPERQGYADFVERFRTEGKKELGANYSEGAFWDWWKRQPTYVSFSQWRLQQAQGTRAGMTAPVMTGAAEAPPSAAPPRRPPYGGAPPGAGAAPAARAPAARPAPPTRTAPPATAPAMPPATVPSPQPVAAPAAAAAPAVGMKNCPNCGKQINADFLVCPFCGSVTG
jgi:RNA polymerase subunit RPABC4/transcription elongation factor Spt4